MNKRLPLTKIELSIWGFVLGYYSDNEYMPTRREIAIYCNCTKQAADYFLRNMERKKYIILGRGWRNIIINTQKKV